MPKKSSSKTQPFTINWLYVSAVLAGFLITFVTLHYLERFDRRAAEKVAAEENFHQVVGDARVQSVYYDTLDAVRGADTPKADLQAMYDNALTPNLAARVKAEGASVLFCSDKTPTELRIGRADSENRVSIEEYFSPRADGPDKVVRAQYSADGTKLEAVHCP